MEDIRGKQNNPEKLSAEEIFGGKDVALGKEIVGMLIAEEVGIPVYFRSYGNKKTHFMIDREIGEENYTVRQKENVDRELIGVIIPCAGSKQEFIYLGIYEDDFVFTAGSKHQITFNPETNTSYEGGYKRFSDRVSQNFNLGNEKYNLNIAFREHERPDEFVKKVEEAVEAERAKQQAIKKSREEIRRGLKNRLFS
jgi:hypothetical protein